MSIVSALFDKTLTAIVKGDAPVPKLELVGENEIVEEFAEEEEEEKKLSAKSAWAILILALLVRILLVFYLVPFMWNMSAKPAFGLKKELDGKMAVALVFLIDFLM